MKFPKGELEFVESKDFYAKQDEDYLYVMNINNHYCDSLYKDPKKRNEPNVFVEEILG